MVRIAIFLSALAIFAMITQPVMAGMFSIYIVYENGNPAANAYVEIWQGDNKIDSGNADSDGVFWTFLREGGLYHITARAANGQTASWFGRAHGTLFLNNTTYNNISDRGSALDVKEDIKY